MNTLVRTARDLRRIAEDIESVPKTMTPNEAAAELEIIVVRHKRVGTNDEEPMNPCTYLRGPWYGPWTWDTTYCGTQTSPWRSDRGFGDCSGRETKRCQ